MPNYEGWWSADDAANSFSFSRHKKIFYCFLQRNFINNFFGSPCGLSPYADDGSADNLESQIEEMRAKIQGPRAINFTLKNSVSFRLPSGELRKCMYQNMRILFGIEREFEIAIDEENDVENTNCRSCATLTVYIFIQFMVLFHSPFSFGCLCYGETLFIGS